MNRRPLATALVALTLAAACGGPPMPNPPQTSEPAMPNTEIPETTATTEISATSEPPPATPGVTDTESEIVREILAVRDLVKRYITAVTAKNEAEAARFTCNKETPGMLWISSMGHPITLRAVTGIVLESIDGRFASVKIQVEGKPTSPLNLKQVGGEWCVWR